MPRVALAALLLAACGEDHSASTVSVDARHLFELQPTTIELAESLLPADLEQLLAREEVWIARETLPDSAWRLGGEQPAEGGFYPLIATPHLPVLAPARVLTRALASDRSAGRTPDDAGGSELEPDEVRIGPAGVEVRYSTDPTRPPPFEISYPTSSAAVARELLGRPEGGGAGYAPGILELGNEARRAAITSGRARLAWTLEVPEQGQLRVGYGLHALEYSIEDGALVLGAGPEAEQQSGVARFRVELLDGDECHELWSAELGPESSGEIQDALVELADWAGREVQLALVTEVEGERGERVLPFWAEPVLDAPDPGQRPNVLFLSLDTLRADRLGCYGYERDTSPRLDELAARGVLFSDTMSAAPTTLPSHVTLFSSLYPSQHEVWFRQRMSAEVLTVAEVLRAAGYQTAARTEGGFVHPAFGLAQGFDRFEAGKWDISETVSDAMGWLDETRGRFFLFVHSYQSHLPYGPPARHRERFVRPYDGNLPEFVPSGWTQHMTPGRLEDDRRYLSDLYDAEVAYADEQVGRLLDHLEASGRLANTLVLVTSDHGEEFLDHGGWGHGYSLHQEQLRVPVIVYQAGAFEGGLVVRHPVHAVDVAPTIVRAAGLRLPESWSGVPLSVSAPTGTRPLFSAYRVPPWGEFASALREGQAKLIHFPAHLRSTEVDHDVDLYDLERDPTEQRNLFDADKHAAMRGRVDTLLERLGPITDSTRNRMDAQLDDALDQLGYGGD